MKNIEQKHTPGPVTIRFETTLHTERGGDLAHVRGPHNNTETEATTRLLTASYNAFDSAAVRLGLNAVELAERMQDGGIADLVEALRGLRDVVFGDQDEILVGPGAMHDALVSSKEALIKVGGRA